MIANKRTCSADSSRENAEVNEKIIADVAKLAGDYFTTKHK